MGHDGGRIFQWGVAGVAGGRGIYRRYGLGMWVANRQCMKHLRAEDVGVSRAVDAAVVCGRVVDREDDFGAVVAASIGAVMHRTIIPGNIIRGAASRWSCV